MAASNFRLHELHSKNNPLCELGRPVEAEEVLVFAKVYMERENVGPHCRDIISCDGTFDLSLAFGAAVSATDINTLAAHPRLPNASSTINTLKMR
jgi:hypothetical protein